MKPKRTHTRKPAAIGNTRWLAYATAGAASALTAATSAEGAIHYSGLINQWIGHTRQLHFPLDQKGDSLGFEHHLIRSRGPGGTARYDISGLVGAACAGFYHTCSGNNSHAIAYNLERGQLISSQRFLGVPSGFVWFSRPRICGNYGDFKENQVGYIGFKFNNGSGEQYGWARIALGRPDQAVKLIDYAYGDVGDLVTVGQKSDDQAASNEGSLGWLALGAVGLLVWRKRRSGVAGTATTRA